MFRTFTVQDILHIIHISIPQLIFKLMYICTLFNQNSVLLRSQSIGISCTSVCSAIIYTKNSGQHFFLFWSWIFFQRVYEATSSSNAKYMKQVEPLAASACAVMAWTPTSIPYSAILRTQWRANRNFFYFLKVFLLIFRNGRGIWSFEPNWVII